VLIEAFSDIEPILALYADAHHDFSFGGLPFSRMRHEIPEMLGEMRDSAQRIKRIVDDLKNFVNPGILSVNHEIDLNLALQTAVRLTSTEIRRSTHDFSASYAGELAPVSGLSMRLEQVLVNLIINACQALPDKNCGLAVATRYDATDGMNVVEVRDQGKGIEEKHLKHLTDPFFTTRRESGGTGLGLSVSARIVKEHGGELRFASVPGRGTVVTLRLPPIKEVNE
jgi:polar amino acid transport system substrate-binding protein